ncbi:MAG TPA: CBS domain-containing protein [Noviherbaspirillum sp.]
MGKAISSIMQRVISPVRMDDTIDIVERVMKANRISSTPVCDDGGAILGIITTTDLLRHHASGKDSSAVKAWELCTYKPLQVSPDTPATKVAELMIEHRTHHVLVMDGPSAEGIVSALDFVRLYLDECRN